MKVFLKHWFLPIGFQQIIKRKPTIKYPKIVADTTKNTKFKNIHQNKRCFILASGPSITKQDLKPLKNEICIAVSSFFNHPDINFIQPKYHVIAPMHSPFTFVEGSIVLNGLKEKYNYPIDIFIGTKGYKYCYFECIKEKNINLNQNIYPINYVNAEFLNENSINNLNSWDLTKNPFASRTVIYSAIQLAFYMGFNEIILLGCDHDYLNDTNRTENHHFYKEDESFSDKKHLSAFTTEKWFLEYYNRWKDYRLMDEFLKKKNVQIINATEGGMLDVFPRKKLSDFFN
jgi:hypothetical protein